MPRSSRPGVSEMGNMSYCRFSNTSHDLEDCVTAMEEAYNLEEMDLSEDEAQAMDSMYEQAKRYIELYRCLMNIEEED